MIFLKILAFLGILIGIGIILMIIFSGNLAILGMITLVTVSIGALAVADLAVFFIVLICGSEKTKRHWKSFFSLIIASVAALIIGVLFNVFLSAVPFMSLLSYGLALLLFFAVIVNLVCNIFYAIFGTDKITVPWKLFVFFLILTGISGVISLFSASLNKTASSGSSIISSVSLMVTCGSLLATIVSLLTVIVNKIYSVKSINSLFKLFLSLIITSAVSSAVSGIFHLIFTPLRKILIFISGLVLFVGVGVFIVIVFRSIFLNKPFCRSNIQRNKNAEANFETNEIAAQSNVISDSAVNNVSSPDNTNVTVNNTSSNGFDISNGQKS